MSENKITVVRQMAAGIPLFQGDVMVELVAGPVPVSFKAVETKVIAHSETGHDHTVEHGSVFENKTNPMELYVQCNYAEDGQPFMDFVHHRPGNHPHTTIRVECEAGQVFLIGRQRESAPEGWRQVKD